MATGFKYSGLTNLHAADQPKYQLRGYVSNNTELGSDAEVYADTIKAAKAKAKYLLSEEYMKACESTQRLQRVLIFKGTECLEDFTQ